MFGRTGFRATATLSLALLSCQAVLAQKGNKFDFPLNIADPKKPAGEGVTASFIADVKAIQPGKPFTLGVRLEVQEGFHTFYRSSGGVPRPTKVAIHAPSGFQVGPVKFPGPDVEAIELGKAEGKTQVEVNYTYQHSTVVMATVTPLSTMPTNDCEFTADVYFQYCKNAGSCLPPREVKLKLKLPVGSKKNPAPPSAEAPLFAEAQDQLPTSGESGDFLRVHADLDSALSQPGERGFLTVVVDFEGAWFLPAHRTDYKHVASTELVLHDTAGLAFEAPQFPEPKQKPLFIEGHAGLTGYEKRLAIRVPVVVKKADAGRQIVSGLLRYQLLGYPTEKFPVRFASFSALIPSTGGASVVANTGANPASAAPAGNGHSTELLPTSSSTGAIGDMSFDIDQGPEQSFAIYIVYAMLGGLILNIMPCVLPVIAIKVLSFVRQAGEDRSRIFLLNLWYAAGVISVFLVLATLAVTAKVGWGELFQKPEFNLVMAGIVFAMGLSLLGVFEIPVPGFAGSAGHHEGLPGAFMTGILATLLATPCSGPFLGVALTWSLKQPAEVTFAVWFAMGVGMAAPYLVIGAFPALVKWLPKPGDWMVTFKEVAGLVLMGTVVYLFTTLDANYLLPALIIVTGLAGSLWMIGRLYDINSSTSKRNVVRIMALLLTVGASMLALGPMKKRALEKDERRLAAAIHRAGLKGPKVDAAAKQDNGEIEFELYSDARLKELLEQQKTIMIDFTADWCPTCHAVEAAAIHTRDFEKVAQEFGIAALLADRTNGKATEEGREVEAIFKKFGGEAIPYLVLVPADNPTKPVILQDGYTKTDLIAALRKAGPSKKIN